MLAARRQAASTSAPLLRRRLSAQPETTAPPPPPPPSHEGAGVWARRGVALSLLGLTGAVASSAVSELAVFLSCSSQAMEKATQNGQIADAIGKPIGRGPWYSASIAVNKARRSVSCTFPVSGPQGDGLLKFKAVRAGVHAKEQGNECWWRYEERNENGRNDRDKDDKGANAAYSYGVDTNWYPDTGATDHITGNLEKLMIKDKYHGNDKIHTANGEGSGNGESSS